MSGFIPRNKNKKKALPWNSRTLAAELMPKEYGPGKTHTRKVTKIEASAKVVLSVTVSDTIPVVYDRVAPTLNDRNKHSMSPAFSDLSAKLVNLQCK